MATHLLALLVLSSYLTAADLVGIPTVPFQETDGYFDLSSLSDIVVDTTHCEATDTDGHTLIPPTLLEFATTFASDLEHTGCDAKASTGDKASEGGIYITIGNSSEFVDAAGRWTSEAYSLNVSTSGITIIGASPLGAWWATRSILQQAALNNGSVPNGYGIDAPGWGTRGIMLDCARHYYPPEFIIELCTWQSYWKNNIFQFHLSDNLYNNPNYTREQEMDLYARFRLLSDDPRVAGLNKHANESYTREDFDRIQSACAARGVTVIPEIESPGHALVISQWKPELGLEGTLDLLNITYPDTIPTIKSIWDVFAPWFKSRVFHIGADEYSDDSLSEYETGEAYNFFVKSMNDYIRSTFDRPMRIWGTFPPQSNYTNNVDTDVSIQHWEFFEDNPYYDYILNNYSVVNSDDRVYIVTKYSTSYPQQLNETFIFHGNPNGGAWSPNIFDSTNSSNNAERDNPYIIGHIAPQWNDYGANTSTYLEAYYSWRNGLPALADKQWGGNLSQADYGIISEKLQASAPAQNLDRVIKSKSSTMLHYNFNSTSQGESEVEDQSGNGYNGKTDCSVSSALEIRSGCSLTTPLESKGEDYTLSFSVKPSSGALGPIFSGKDSILQSSNSSLDLVSGGYAYALNYSLPIGEWTQAKLVRSGNRTFFGANREPEMEFFGRIGVNGERFEWVSMAINAPLHSIGGGNWEGDISEVKLVDYAS